MSFDNISEFLCYCQETETEGPIFLIKEPQINCHRLKKYQT
jgi:hypothetical protein